MKIAHITSVHPENDNRILYKEAVTLAHNGYDVTLIVSGGTNKNIDGVKRISYPRVEGGRLKRMLKTSFFDMLKVCKKVDADIYHFHDPELMFIGLYLKVMGKRVIYDIHENNPASILSKPYIKSKIVKKILSKTFDIFEKNVVKAFDAIVTARPDITARFKHEKLVTLRNFPILPNKNSVVKKNISKDKHSVIFVGNMTDIRGINQLLDAFELLENIELWLLGSIKEEALAQRVKKGCKNVIYLGLVEPFEIFSYIEEADIGIITFLEAPNHIHTLATKPFEYMACGKPMVMSNFDYWKETFKESSLYVDPSNPKDIANKIEELINNKALFNKMGKLNKELSENEYNWDKESKKLIEVYRSLEV